MIGHEAVRKNDELLHTRDCQNVRQHEIYDVVPDEQSFASMRPQREEVPHRAPS